MAVIAPCAYKNGELLAPALIPKLDAIARLDYKNAKFFPTFDVDYTHVFRITTYGLTRDAAEKEIKRKTGSFFKKMHQVEGFKTIKSKMNEGYIPINRNHSFTWEIFYAIENTGTRTQNPDSPYPEYQRDLSRLSFAPETATVLLRA